MRNEIADRLAKGQQLIEEVEDMTEETTPATHLDIGDAVRTACPLKWQKRLDAGNTGRYTI